MARRYPRGSAWNKWDLQIQPIKSEWLCDLSNKRAEIKRATRDYLRGAVEQGIKIVAITDHNCGAAIDAALEVVVEEDLDITVLPGVEIDERGGYQLLVIFNPNYKGRIGKNTWEDAVNHFLNHICRLPSPVINEETGVAESIRGDTHEILAAICADDIGLPIFAHAQSDKGLFKKTTATNRKEFFVNALAGKYFFAVDHKTDQHIEKTRQALLDWGLDSRAFALIKTSDAHSASEAGGTFTWIKAEHTYEGLKQIIYDPTSRISTLTSEPIKPTNIIDAILFNIPKNAKITLRRKNQKEKQEAFCFAGTKGKYELSPFLNCFIGGRGSGKSTVLNFLGQHSTDPASSEEFWERISPTFDSADRALFSFDGVEVFEFIGQSEVESFATNKEAFTAAIYERANLLVDGLLQRREDELDRLLKQFEGFRLIVESLKTLDEEKRAKEREKKTLENSIKVTNTKEYGQLVDEITKKSNQRQQLEGWRVRIQDFREALTALKGEHPEPEGQSVDIEAGPEVSESDLVAPYRAAFMQAKENVSSAIDILDGRNFKDLVNQEQQLGREIEADERELSKLLKQAGLSEENVLQAKGAPQKLVRVDDELAKISKRIAEQTEQLSRYPEIVTRTGQARVTYESAIQDAMKPLVSTLEEQARENRGKDIKNIGLSYFFDEEAAWQSVAGELHRYFAKNFGERERQDFLKGYIVENKEVFRRDESAVRAFLKKGDRKAGYVRFLQDVFEEVGNFRIFETLRDKHLHDVAKYKRIQVLYDGKDIERASFGQKCTAVMVILLLFGNYPLIIDEPEAHLDSSLIANYLVPLIKRKKDNRQIIFSTHNANFVVNGDAEKIFVLVNDTGHTEVIETTIEDLEHREDLLKLEGGREAFKKRGEKLHI